MVAIIPDNLKVIKVGLGWDSLCDLDTSIILMDQDSEILEIIYYGNLKSENNAVIHHGDNLTGIGDGDDEVIEIFLDKLHISVKYIWVVINIYTNGKSFSDVKGAFCRLFN